MSIGSFLKKRITAEEDKKVVEDHGKYRGCQDDPVSLNTRQSSFHLGYIRGMKKMTEFFIEAIKL